MFDQFFAPQRLTEPDYASLLANLRALDATVAVWIQNELSYRLTKSTAWTGPQIAAAQNVINTTVAKSAQLTAQGEIDQLGIREKAIILALIDQLNIIRAALVPPKIAITPQMALDAVRAKAGTL